MLVHSIVYWIPRMYSNICDLWFGFSAYLSSRLCQVLFPLVNNITWYALVGI